MKEITPIEEYYQYINNTRLHYYHGTSSALNIKNLLLPPSESGVIREDFRKRNLNEVFLTTSKLSALRYAVKAAARFGGVPVVYEVEPDFTTCEPRIDNEYICSYAKIKCEVSNF